MMKVTSSTTISLATLATLAIAAPIIRRQEAADCNVGFVFARASSAPAPIGVVIGPSLQQNLQDAIVGLQTFPIAYESNTSTRNAIEAFTKAQSCKQIIAAGYNEGTEVLYNTISTSLPRGTKSKIAGVALFGTQDEQSPGYIPNFPADKSRTWCNVLAGGCKGKSRVNTASVTYSNLQMKEAADYLVSRVKSSEKTGLESILRREARRG